MDHDTRPFSIEDYTEETGILSPSLQEDVFREVQRAQEAVLLEGVDTTSLEQSINVSFLVNIFDKAK